jgi:hypothetical protein
MRRKKDKRMAQAQTADAFGPTKERLARSRSWVDVPTDVPGVTAKQDLIECVVDRYHVRMQINDRQRDAGIRFRALWRCAVIEPATTSAYGERQGGGGGSIPLKDARVAARHALLGADLAKQSPAEPIRVRDEIFYPAWLNAVLLPAGLVTVAVCGADEWAGGTRRLMMLRDGLTALADYWGMER